MASDPRLDPRLARFASTAVQLDPKPAASAGSVSAGPSSADVIDVTDATLQAEVLERSLQVPVVLDLWASWCQPCKQLSPVLERLARAGGGAWVLAKVDVDANPRISQALRVQSIPTVLGVLSGQLVEMFTGAQPEAVVQEYIDQLLEMARQAGLDGQDGPGGPDGGPAAPPPYDEDLRRGDEALERNDLEGAVVAYRTLLERQPGSTDALQGLARVELVRRATQPPGPEATEIDRVLHAAARAVLSERPEAGIDALVDLVGRTAGAEREQARRFLVEVFDAMGPDDPAVVSGRRRLTAVLF